MRSDFRLVDTGWGDVFDEALQFSDSTLLIVCPFIKKRVAERLLKQKRPKHIKIITRFNLIDFCDGVSDTKALRILLDNGAQIRGVRNLHAKLYIFGESRAIVTSANLTDAALLRNHEFGFVADDPKVIDCCRTYFDDLWGRAGQDLTVKRLEEWEKRIEVHLASGARSSRRTGLGDEGVDAGGTVPLVVLPAFVAEARQAFVKFFGTNSNRATRNLSVLEEVERAGCHWACTYPLGKRPRQVKDGAIIFMARMVKEPNDIIIFGRAVAMKHEEGRDDATDADKKLRDFKEKWPHYIRVHHAEFLSGTMENGVSLNKLMDELRANAFVSTQRNTAKKAGNTDPRKAYMQQPAVELSPQGIEWLNGKLEEAFTKYGRLAAAELEHLDWPSLPERATRGATR